MRFKFLILALPLIVTVKALTLAQDAVQTPMSREFNFPKRNIEMPIHRVPQPLPKPIFIRPLEPQAPTEAVTIADEPVSSDPNQPIRRSLPPRPEITARPSFRWPPVRPVLGSLETQTLSNPALSTTVTPLPPSTGLPQDTRSPFRLPQGPKPIPNPYFIRRIESASENPPLQSTPYPRSYLSYRPTFRPNAPILLPSTPVPKIETQEQPGPQPEPQPILKTEPQPILRPEPQPILIAEPQPIRSPELQPILRPESQSIRRPEPQPILRPESQSILRPEPQPILRPESQSILKPELQPILRPESQPIPRPEPQPILLPQPQPILRPESQPILRPDLQPILRPESQPNLRPEPQPILLPQPQPILRPESQPTLRPEPQPDLLPVTQPDLIPEPHVDPERKPHDEQEPEPQPYSIPEPQPDSIPVSWQRPVLRPQPISRPVLEPQPVPRPIPQPIFYSETNSNPQLIPVPQPRPRPVPIPQSVPKPQPIRPITTPKPYNPMTTQLPYLTEPRPEAGVPIEYNCVQDGFYSIANECDAYIECKKRSALKYICPDGLNFNRNALYPEYPCAYPSEVQCDITARSREPQPTSQCPRQYGFFPMNDGDCSQYLMCQEGLATIMRCPPGLAFNPVQDACDWPGNVPSCRPSVFQGFSCPPAPVDEYGEPNDWIYKYKYGKSCKEYVACQRGHPRLLSCDPGLAFDETSETCVDADYVPGCSAI